MPVNKTDKKQSFLDDLKQHGNVTRSAERMGITRRLVYTWAAKDQEFNAALAKAKQQALAF